MDLVINLPSFTTNQSHRRTTEQGETFMGLIPILLVVVIILLLTHSKGRPFRISKSAANARDPIHLILLVVVVLLLVGLVVNLAAPLGTYRLW